jgi:Tol biopolymer transport system component
MRCGWKLAPWLSFVLLLACGGGGGGGAATSAPSAAPAPSSAPTVVYVHYVGSQADIFSIKADGTGLVTLANTTDDERPIRVMGDRLLYHRITGGQYDLYSVKLDGTGSVALANTSLSEYFAEVAGSKVIYLRQNATTWDLFSVYPDGTGRVQLASNVVGSAYGGTVLVKGDQVIFSSLATGSTGIYAIHADGTGLSSLYASTKNAYVSNAASDRVVFSLQETTGSTLHAVNFDGTAHAQLTTTGKCFPSCSVGGRLVYLLETLSTSPYRYSIYSVNLDGTDTRAVATNSAKDQRFINVLGNRIVYQSTDASVSEVYSCNPDGTGSMAMSPLGQKYYLAYRALAGDHVVMTKGAYGDPTNQLYTVAADGTGLSALSAGTEQAIYWGYDSGRLYFTLRLAGQDDLFSCAMDGTGRKGVGTSPSYNESYPLLMDGWAVFNTAYTDGSGNVSLQAVKNNATTAVTLAGAGCQMVLMY